MLFYFKLQRYIFILYFSKKNQNLFSVYFLFSVKTLRRPRIASNAAAGLAKWRLPIPFMRATNFQFRITFSAWLMPPLRQTAR
jgi:hypothetical protein